MSRINKKKDIEISKATKEGAICFMAGHYFDCYGPLEDHHIVTRGESKKLRHEPENHICLCIGHHQFAHGKTWMFREWLNKNYDGLYDRLKRESRNIKPIPGNERLKA